MLRRPLSQTPLLGVLRESECPRCHRSVDLPIGALCRGCEVEIERRAGRIARLAAAIGTLLVALYVWLRMPAQAADVQRLVAALGVVIWYVLSFVVVKRVCREYLR